MRERPRFTVELRSGRLVEARVFWLKTAQDTADYQSALATEFAKVPSTLQPVLCADHRPVRVYPTPAADALTEAFRGNNTRLERAALVIDPSNATLLMQLERIVREASYERRRVFRDASGALAHLSAVLNEREQRRAGEFLAEWTEPAR